MSHIAISNMESFNYSSMRTYNKFYEIGLNIGEIWKLISCTNIRKIQIITNIISRLI